jgi:hypothetical protein
MLVEIRFNNKFSDQKSQYQWRVLCDGVETLVNEITINTPTYTGSRFIEGEGMKYHIITNAKKVDIEEVDGEKYAYIT